MNYSKPEVVVLANAVAAIKGTQKGSHFVIDSADLNKRTLTPAAYESDE